MWLASAPEGGGTTGRYLHERKEIRSSPLSYDRALGQALWDRCARETGLPA